MPRPRQYVATKVGVEIESEFIGWVRSAEGGEAYAEVITEPGGSAGYAKKKLGAVSYADITLRFAAGMSNRFYSLIGDLMEGTVHSLSGAVVEADINWKESARSDFTDALTTEFVLPALVGTSKELGEMTLVLSPGQTRRSKGSGRRVGVERQPGKQWSMSGFRLHIDGLDCTRIKRIEPLTVSSSAVGNHASGSGVRRAAASLTVSDLVVTLPRAAATGWEQWHEEFVINRNGGGGEKNGRLELLAADTNTVLFSVGLIGLGIFRLESSRTSDTDEVLCVRASLYCQQASFASLH